jgi:hypothetical protein
VNVQLLIDSVVQQVTVLIAQLATSGGARAPVAHIASQVFVDLAHELEAQGLSRKVSADMFGMALRAYQRKLARLSSEAPGRGDTLWRSLLDLIEAEGPLTRSEVLSRYASDDETLIRGVLHDLCESGLLACTGKGADAEYRARSERELRRQVTRANERGLDELVWAFVYRGGPVDAASLARRLHLDVEAVRLRLDALVTRGRLHLVDGRYEAHELVIPLDAEAGWEAAVFDHVQALVQTICQRLRALDAQEPAQHIGGSTYSFDVWDGHPLLDEVEGTLARFRSAHSQLRARVEAYNAKHGMPRAFRQVVVYGGQCVLEREQSRRSASIRPARKRKSIAPGTQRGKKHG